MMASPDSRSNALMDLASLHPTWPAAIAAIVAVGAAWRYLRGSSQQQGAQPGALPLPPSPPAVPVLGHLHLLATTSDPSKLLDDLAAKLGPVYSLRMGTTLAVVISSKALAQETLVKHGKTYAGRWVGKVPMLISDNGLDLAFAQYGPEWRHRRQIAHKVLSAPTLNHFDALLDREALRLVDHLHSHLHDAEGIDMAPLMMRYTCNIIAGKSLNVSFASPDDPIFKMIIESVLEFFHLAGVGGVEDYFPGGFLESIVMIHKRRRLAAIHAKFHNGWLLSRILELKANLDAEVAAGVDPRSRGLCFCEELLLDQELSLDEIKLLMTDFMFAGLDTTATTLHWIFIYLANNQEVQDRAFKDLVSATNNLERLPGLGDMDALPFIGAIVKETLRIRPVGPLGLPRMTVDDDMVAGDKYMIPKGTQIIYHVARIHAEIEPNQSFNPEAWLNTDGAEPEKKKSQRGDPMDPFDGVLTFGMGRRVCPGAQLAFREMFLTVARTLACFRIENARGGAKVSIPTDYEFGLTVQPKAHPRLRFVPRSDRVADLLRHHKSQEDN